MWLMMIVTSILFLLVLGFVFSEAWNEPECRVPIVLNTILFLVITITMIVGEYRLVAAEEARWKAQCTASYMHCMPERER
ncbi:hypothetical protein LCM4573_26935 [Rhizobium sp. LCM 4573]|nr:hypothetical protein LCM4573_26935 [Rhizobium sp. LCM 4573]